MPFDTKVDGVTEETQALLDDFFSHYEDPISYRNVIRKIPTKIGVTDFKKLTYKHCELLLNEYPTKGSNRSGIESLFKYLYLLDVLAEKQKFAERFGDKEKIRKKFESYKNKDIVPSKGKKESESMLSFAQIEKLLEYCDKVEAATDFSSYKNLRMAFAFYVMFFQGVSVNGLKDMDIKTYSEGTLILDDKLITVPEKFYCKKNVISEWDAKDIELVTADEKERITHYVSSYDKLKEKLKTPCDFETWNKYMKLIGNLGEKYVYEREVRKLIAAKREDLAECVNADIAKDHNNGYDVLSYTETGEELHIEVKATPGTLDTPFYISKNEWDRAMEFKEQGKLYELHRVYNVGKENVAVKVYTDIQSLKCEEVLYKVDLSKV